MVLNVSAPPNPVPCQWGPELDGQYVPGCASGGYPCDQYATLAEAQAACALDYGCGGVTSQDSGGAPWETRRGPGAVSSQQGEKSYVIANDCHGDGGLCFFLPPTFAIITSGFSNDVLVSAMARYSSIINSAYGVTVNAAPQLQPLNSLTVNVAADAKLQFGVDESYTLSVAAGGATLTAPTVWGAIRGLETVSQLARHTWTTSSAGAVNASFNEICAITVTDAPRFAYRGLMIDTSRHFMPVNVVKQIMELMAYNKMNSLRMHLIDDQSWSYYVEDAPAVTNNSAFSPLHVYYPSDLTDLVAFGRARGIIVWPEVDFPGHSSILLETFPEMGCLLPPPNSYRQYIDPLWPDLWPTMAKVFNGINKIFPPEYPFHMGGDEVNRNAWAECPTVIEWCNTTGHCSGNVGDGVTSWWYQSLYIFLHNPPYNRVVYAWEDATGSVNSNWTGATDGGLVLEQWNGDPGAWNSYPCSSGTNSSILMSGPFHDVIGTGPSYNSNPEENYYDMWNLTCPLSPRIKEQIIGAELMWWCDAADISASDTILMLMSSVLPVAESGWSPQSVVAPGLVNAGRYQDHRCRLARRGMQSHDAYGHVGTYCVAEYEQVLMPWSML